MATPSKNKTNFKTYEASTRLLAAVLATNQCKLDYVELAKHVGGGASKDAINHRLRPIKQLAKMQAACVKNGEDPGELPCDKGALAGLVGEGTTCHALEHRMRPIKKLADEFATQLKTKNETPVGKSSAKGEIQKLFGESTPSGIEWQFREIKNLGKAQAEAVKKGENPATLLVAGTPHNRKRAAAGTPTTGARSRKRTATGTPTATAVIPPVDSSDDNASDGDVESPSKRRATAKKARATATSMTPKATNGTAAPSNGTPSKVPMATPNGAGTAARAAGTSIFGNGASLTSSDVFSHGLEMSGQYHAPNSRPTGSPATIKKEFTTSANPFLGAATATAFDEGDHYEEGEV